MSETTGRALPLSRARRLVIDFMHFCRPAQTEAAERPAALAAVAVARQAADPKPGWFAVLLKAYGLAGVAVPSLRLSRLTFPYPRLYRHPESTALVTFERELDGEPGVLVCPVRKLERKPITEIQAELDWVRSAPVDEVKPFRRALSMLRLPRPVRRAVMWLGLRVCGPWREQYFGTCTVSSVAAGGGALTFALCPHTAFFAPAPVAPDGATTLRLFYDRRVIDAATADAALAAVEEALCGPVLAELRGLARPLSAAV